METRIRTSERIRARIGTADIDRMKKMTYFLDAWPSLKTRPLKSQDQNRDWGSIWNIEGKIWDWR